MEVLYRDEGVASAASSVAGRLVSGGVPARLAAGDPALWGEDAGGRAVLTPFRAPRELLGRLAELAEQARSAGLTNVVLAAAGGTALAAEVICDTADVPLTVLDTTDPGQVRRALAEPLESTVLVVAGPATEGAAEGVTESATRRFGESAVEGAVEVDACLRVYERAFEAAGLSPAAHIVVVTGPGTPVERRAVAGGYPTLPGDGGAVLPAAALAASALAGADVARLVDDAEEVLPLLSRDSGNPGLDLGAALGGAALAGRDKLLLEDQLTAIAGLPDWIEWLVAGYTGKRGRGILPVVGADPNRTSDELVVAIESDVGDVRVDGPLGAQFAVWEYAAAVAALLLEVDPADRPDPVGAARDLAARPGPPPGKPAFTDGPVEVYGPTTAKDLPGLFADLLHAIPADGYLAVTAYLDRLAAFDAPVPDGADFEQMTDAWMMADPATLRALLAIRTDRPVTFGWGPRFLHTAGHYQGRGPANGVFLQVTGGVADDVEVPGRPYTLGRLQLAQALGHLEALAARGRPAVRVHLTDRAAGVARLLAAAQEV